MKKIFLIFTILCLSLFVLTSCSNNNNDNSNNTLETNVKSNGKPERISSSNDDEIKFLRIDWLTESNDVEKELNDRYGKDYQGRDGLNAYGNVYSVDYFNKEDREKSLLWEIGGQKIQTLCLRYYTPDKGTHNYLYSAEIKFDNPSVSIYDDLFYKLDNLYDRVDNKVDSDSKKSEFRDKNNNLARLTYSNKFGETFVSLKYLCSEIGDMISKENETHNNEYEERLKEGQRQITPDL